MRFSQLKLLTEEELSLLVIVIQTLEPIVSPKYEIKTLKDILFLSPASIISKLKQQEQNLNDGGKVIYQSLIAKLSRTPQQEIEDYENSTKPELTQSEFQF
jgi:hypothetical protein